MVRSTQGSNDSGRHLRGRDKLFRRRCLVGGGTSTPINDIIGQAWSPQWDIGAEKFATGAITLTSVNLSGNTFTYSAPASTVIGAVTVSATGGSFSGTLSITGINSGNFALSSSTVPSNLTCSVSLTCPVSGGPFTDINIVATQAGATGSPLSQAETITGSSPPAQIGLRWLRR